MFLEHFNNIGTVYIYIFGVNISVMEVYLFKKKRYIIIYMNIVLLKSGFAVTKHYIEIYKGLDSSKRSENLTNRKIWQFFINMDIQIFVQLPQQLTQTQVSLIPSKNFQVISQGHPLLEKL